MKQRLLVAILTVVVFAAGFVARVVTESGPSVPPPPAAGAEFLRSASSNATSDTRDRKAPPVDADRAKLLADIAKTRPQIEAYRQRMSEIENDFEREFVALLTPEQMASFAARKQKTAEKHLREAQTAAARKGPLTDEEVQKQLREPLFHALDAVVITWRFNYLKREYKLSEDQLVKTRAILEARRQRFLALVDTIQPPTITLSQLANQVEKLGGPTASK